MKSNKEILFVANPVSGNGDVKHVIEKLKSLGNNDFDLILSESHFDAIRIVKSNLDNYNTFVAVGGDGTVNEVLNGLNLTQGKRIGVIPVGSGNDFAYNIYNSKSIEIAELIDKFINKKYQSVTMDTGECSYKKDGKWEKRLFACNLGLGFDALVAYKNQYEKKFPGKTGYIYSILSAIKDLQNITYEINFDNTEIHNFSGPLCSIGNGKTAGGGIFLTPEAELNDGLLDFTCSTKVNKLKLFHKLTKILNGNIKYIKSVKFRKFFSADIKLNIPYYLHTDGEILSHTVKEIYIRNLKNSIEVIK